MRGEVITNAVLRQLSRTLLGMSTGWSLYHLATRPSQGFHSIPGIQEIDYKPNRTRLGSPEYRSPFKQGMDTRWT